MQICTHVTQSITKKVNPLFKWKYKSRFFNSCEKKGKAKRNTKHVIVLNISFINALDKAKKHMGKSVGVMVEVLGLQIEQAGFKY